MPILAHILTNDQVEPLLDRLRFKVAWYAGLNHGRLWQTIEASLDPPNMSQPSQIQQTPSHNIFSHLIYPNEQFSTKQTYFKLEMDDNNYESFKQMYRKRSNASQVKLEQLCLHNIFLVRFMITMGHVLTKSNHKKERGRNFTIDFTFQESKHIYRDYMYNIYLLLNLLLFLAHFDCAQCWNLLKHLFLTPFKWWWTK